VRKLTVFFLATLMIGCTETAPTWQLIESSEYGRDELYNYIDGGAVYFLERGFQKAIVKRYGCKQRKATVTVEIYNMKQVSDAERIFRESTTDNGQPINVGRSGSVYPSYAEFWRDNLYVRILAYDLGDDVNTITYLAQAVDSGKL